MSENLLCGEEHHGRTFRRHVIDVRRQFGKCWYIRVYAPNGCAAYDGWWNDSENKTAAEAIDEAKRGAGLAKATRSQP